MVQVLSVSKADFPGALPYISLYVGFSHVSTFNMSKQIPTHTAEVLCTENLRPREKTRTKTVLVDDKLWR